MRVSLLKSKMLTIKFIDYLSNESKVSESEIKSTLYSSSRTLSVI